MTTGTSNNNYRHGYCLNPETRKLMDVFYNARARCTKPTAPRYADYGGRGIRFLFTSIEQFITELGPKPQDGQRYTVDRIDNAKDYAPGNIQWATYKQQANNRRTGSGWWGSHNHGK